VEELWRAIDQTISSWPDVKPKHVFGHRGYVRRGKMFAFLADDGVSVKITDDAYRDELYARDDVKPFFYNGTMEMRAWPVLPLRTEDDVAEVLSAVQRALETL
jgi:hypothetical protein